MNAMMVSYARDPTKYERTWQLSTTAACVNKQFFSSIPHFFHIQRVPDTSGCVWTWGMLELGSIFCDLSGSMADRTNGGSR